MIRTFQGSPRILCRAAGNIVIWRLVGQKQKIKFEPSNGPSFIDLAQLREKRSKVFYLTLGEPHYSTLLLASR